MRSAAVWRNWLRARTNRPWVGVGSPVRLDGIDAAQTALVVIDCQPEVLRTVAAADDLLSRTNAAVDTVRRHHGHVAFVRLAFDELDYRAIPSTNIEASKWCHSRHFRNGTPDADFHRALSIHDDDIVVRKTRLGVFSTTRLDERLTNLGVTTLILAGARTGGALLSTVREAADRDYRLIVLSDCSADTCPDNHDHILHRVIATQAEILTADQLDRALARGASRREREARAG